MFRQVGHFYSAVYTLLRNPFGGSVAYIGNTGHGMLFTGHDFSSALWEQVLDGEVTVGDAVFNAKKS